MRYRSFTFAGLLSILIVLPASVRGEPTLQEKIAGTWKVTDTSRYEETWTFTFADDAWDIKGVYVKNGKEVGKAHGTKVKVLKDGLNFTRVFDKKPATDLGDDAVSTFKLMDSGGDLIFRAAGKTTIRKVTRDEAAVAKPKTDQKTEPAPTADRPFKEVGQLKGPKTIAGMSLAISPDGKRAAMVSSTVGAKTNTVAILNFEDKKAVQRIRPTGITNRLAWSADSKWLATLEAEFCRCRRQAAAVAVWDVETAELRATFDAPKFAAEVAISGDGSGRSSFKGGIAADDGVVKAWDVVAKKEIFSQSIKSTLNRHGLTADGKTLMAVHANLTITRSSTT